jgi:hypothetical protein
MRKIFLNLTRSRRLHFLYHTKQDTKLDVLSILANVAGGDKEAKAEVRVALGGISEWFDDYISTEEADPTMVCGFKGFNDS